MFKENFEDSYKKLNMGQKEAVDSLEGPVMVIAGPGTGKTQILSLRVANILKKTDTPPDAILALTFTESGVHSMRKRLVSIIGSEAYRVNIFTFHGFCNNVIKTYPEEFPRIICSKNISPIDEVQIMESVIDRSNIEKLRPYGEKFYYLDSILRAISDMKREDISPDRLDELISEEENNFKKIEDVLHEKGVHKGKMKAKYIEVLKYIERNKELSLLYRNYEEALLENRFYDYNDMIMETVRALEVNQDLLLRLQENYQYILVDEHQDTNNAQNKVLELISGFYESPNLFIVGDEKQAIFRFQGASLNNFLYFKDKYKEAKIIFLEENYRSTQNILDSAHSLIEKGGEKGRELRKRLVSKTEKDDRKISLASFSSDDNEIFYIADDIESKIKKGLSPGSIAIIYRDNKDAFPIAQILGKYGIPFAIESDQNILEDEDMKKLIVVMEAVNEFGDNEKFIKMLHLDFLKIDEFSIYKLLKFAEKGRKKLLDVVHKNDEIEDIDGLEFTKIKELFMKLASLSKLAKNKPVVEFFEILLKETGFLEYILSDLNSLEKTEKLSVVFDNMKEIALNHRDFKLADFMQFLRVAEGRRLFKKNSSNKLNVDCVHLLTAHRSKGLEFHTVYATGLYDGHFGNRRNRSHFRLPIWGSNLEGFEPNDDERRLFYVAITRAKKEITLTYPNQNSGGKSLLPSQFLSEIDPEYIETLDVSKQEEGFKNNKIKIFEPKGIFSQANIDKQFLNELFLSRGFSVTALNNYLNCPWSYFYRNLIRIPEAPVEPLMYGNAVHYTLRDFFNKLKEDNDIGEEKILQIFEKYITQEPLSDTDLKNSLKKGRNAISGYYRQYINEWNRNIFNEFSIKGIILNNKITLTGNIDKIEILDNSYNVNVVDYKTGSPKSRNDIEGNTKSSDGNYKRQLVFYKLLLDGYDNGKYRMRSGEIDFIEPDSKGRYKKEKFEVSEEEISKLKDLIKNASEEILDLKFWDKRCDDKECKYCKLRSLMAKSH